MVRRRQKGIINGLLQSVVRYTFCHARVIDSRLKVSPVTPFVKVSQLSTLLQLNKAPLPVVPPSGEESLHIALAQWITDNTFPVPADYPEGKLPAVVTSSRLPSDNLLIHAAFGFFEFEGALDKHDHKKLINGSLFIRVHGYQRFKVLGGIDGNLGAGVTKQIDAGKFAKGEVNFFIEKDGKTVSMSWKGLKLQFAADQPDDKTCFFDISKNDQKEASVTSGYDEKTLQKLDAYYSGGVDTLWFKDPFNVIPTGTQFYELSGNALAEAQDKSGSEYQHDLELLQTYVDDHHDTETHNFLIEKYVNKPGPNLTAGSSPYSATVTFLDVFQLVGAISPNDKRTVGTQLYVKIPILGRVKLASLAGNLKGDPKDVTASIDAHVAKGEATLILEDKTLYISAEADIKFLGSRKTGKHKLFTLP
ncbi:hypothetical protein AX14_003280 [Amanita brunnescens Koide BX004]|nr:hypothetical protein AX14_003280 [Amanita brunnescens Koide BX004]